MQKEIRDSIIACIVLSLVLMLPSFFTEMDEITKLGIYIIVDLVILLFLGNNLARRGAFSRRFQQPNWKHLLILFPLVFSFLIGPIYSFIFYPINIQYFLEPENLLYVFYLLLGAIIDELIFRIIFFNKLNPTNRLKRIISSAGIYALFEIVGLFTSHFNVYATVVSIIATFILGIFLGFIMEYGHSVYPCIIFNFLNSVCTLVVMIDTTYLLLYFAMPLLALGYAFLMYQVYFKKKE